jgi:hypothetical protein
VCMPHADVIVAGTDKNVAGADENVTGANGNVMGEIMKEGGRLCGSRCRW